jgi:hypothetical protein
MRSTSGEDAVDVRLAVDDLELGTNPVRFCSAARALFSIVED